jgi:predicted GNAT family acetyltransferase
VYEIDALNTGEEYLAARNDIQKNWEGYNREIGVYAVDSISAIEHGRPLGWVLRDKGELVGVAAISEPDKNYPFIYIGSIAAKRTGYGTVLMKQIAGLAVEYNKEIRLASTNPDADAFYEAIGMVSIGDREPGKGRPYVMPKEKVAELANYRGA